MVSRLILVPLDVDAALPRSLLSNVEVLGSSYLVTPLNQARNGSLNCKSFGDESAIVDEEFWGSWRNYEHAICTAPLLQAAARLS